MNQGVIASRYAKALLKYVSEAGDGSETYSQACILADKMRKVPELAAYICRHPEIPADQKVDLMSVAIDRSLSPEFERFVRLVCTQGRMECFQRMVHSFIDQYRMVHDMKVGRLVSAEHVDGLKEDIENRLRLKTGSDVRLEEEERPDLLGGFVIEVDGLRLDASVLEQLRRLRSGMIEINGRIV